METLRSPSVEPSLLDKVGDFVRIMATVAIESTKNLGETTTITYNQQTGEIQAIPDSQQKILSTPKFPQTPTIFQH